MNKAKFLVLAWLVAVFISGCTDEGATVNTLSAAGFTNITTHGYAFGACGNDDTYATKFEATNPLGNPVSGVVCCGILLKGCTIRY